MSENNAGLQIPAEQPFDTVSFQGSLQQLLQDNIGNYISIDFLIGTTSMVNRSGILYAVGTSYVVLYDDINRQYYVCDLFAVKFITFYLQGHRPGQIPFNPTVTVQDAQPTFATAPYSQAAYAHVRQKTQK